MTMGPDISIKALVGGNWDIQADYWRSLIRAGLLEGRVYVVKNEQKIVSVGVWYEAGNDVFQTFEVSVLKVLTRSWYVRYRDAQRALGFNDFFAKLTPETQEWWNEVWLFRMLQFFNHEGFFQCGKVMAEVSKKAWSKEVRVFIDQSGYDAKLHIGKGTPMVVRQSSDRSSVPKTGVCHEYC